MDHSEHSKMKAKQFLKPQLRKYASEIITKPVKKAAMDINLLFVRKSHYNVETSFGYRE